MLTFFPPCTPLDSMNARVLTPLRFARYNNDECRSASFPTVLSPHRPLPSPHCPPVPPASEPLRRLRSGGGRRHAALQVEAARADVLLPRRARRRRPVLARHQSALQGPCRSPAPSPHSAAARAPPASFCLRRARLRREPAGGTPACGSGGSRAAAPWQCWEAGGGDGWAEGSAAWSKKS
jgi:hypothetical protein